MLNTLTYFRRAALVALCMALGAGGCTGAKGEFETFAVNGKVTHKGQPVTSGSIVFVSNDPKLPRSLGRISSDGSYTMGTYSEGDGVAAGDYRVIIRAFEFGKEPADTSSAAPKPLVPAKYTSLDTTSLTAKVEAKGNHIDFDL